MWNKNQDGIALMMVLTAIVLLSTIMLSFSIDSTVNKIRTYNIEDKTQAKLTAESGIKFAMARLRLYKDAYNYIQNNDGVAKVAKPEILNILWNFPFVYPIPASKEMNKIQKEALAKFQENTLLKGQMRLTITNLSNKLNLNALRVALFKEEVPEKRDENGNPIQQPDPKAEFNVETQLFKNFQNAFTRKTESDEEFYAEYSGTDAEELIGVLKTYVSDEDSLDSNGAVRGKYTDEGTTPKFAPMGSMSEIYSVPGWDDALVDLIKNEFTVHGAVMIDLNKITENMLRLLIPEITDQEVKDFFEYKDNPEDPQFFNSIEDFKKYVTSIGNIMPSNEFDDLIKEFELNNIKFGVSPSLFKITSVGEIERATYTLEAYVIIPAKPAYIKPEDDPNDLNNTATTTNNNSSNNNNNTNSSSSNNSNKKPKVFLMSPRIVEIYSK